MPSRRAPPRLLALLSLAACAPAGDGPSDDEVDTAPPADTDAASLRRPGVTTPFTEIATYPLDVDRIDGLVAKGVSAGDVDGDGLMDVVTSTGPDVLLWLGVGDGTLRPPRVLHAGGSGAFSNGAWLVDLDRDGRLDLLRGGVDGPLALRARGDGTFEDLTATLGLAARPGSLLAAVNVTDLDGDGLEDLFLGYNRLDLRDQFVAHPEPPLDYAATLEDDLYLRRAGEPALRRLTIPTPPPSTGLPGYGWYTWHSLRLAGGLLSIADFANVGGSQSVLYRVVDDGDVEVTPMEQVLDFLPTPMGGFCDTVRPPEWSCWMSDGTTPAVFVQGGGAWFEGARSLGVAHSYFSWSVATDDVDLDGDLDVFVTQAVPAVDLRFPQLVDDGDSGVWLHAQRADGTFDTERLIPGNVLGMTLADLDGDGQREVVALEVNAHDATATSDHVTVLRVLRRQDDVPRVEVRFDPSCLDAAVRYGVTSRRFEPFTNTGSFGNGSSTLTFPYQAGERLVVERPPFAPVEVEPEPDRAVAVRCGP